MLGAAKNRAKDKLWAFDLHKDWLRKRLEAGCCEATKIPFDFGARAAAAPFSPSIDRIDNSKGYTQDNCRVVVWLLNRARSCYTDELLIYTIQQWMANKEGT